LSATPGALDEFNVHALLYARQFYQDRGLFDSTGNRCGVLQVTTSCREELDYQRVVARFDDAALVHWLSCAQASEIAGVKLHFGALHMPGNGWLEPPRLCAALLDHPDIRVLKHTPVHSLQYQEGCWKISGAEGSVVYEADVVIIACATATAD